MTIPALETPPSVTFVVERGTGYQLPFDALGNSSNLNAWYRDSSGDPQTLQFNKDLIINFEIGFGTIYLIKDLEVGSKFTINRVIQNSQAKSFNSTQLYSTRVEGALDKLTLLAQDNDFENTCLRVASDSIIDEETLELPSDKNRIYTALTFDEDGAIELVPLRNIGGQIPATRADLGLVQIGDNLDIDEAGLLNVPLASANRPGVVKIGNGFGLEDGVISVDNEFNPATALALGLVKIGDKLNIDGTGLLNVPVASASTFGVVKVGSGVHINDGVISVDTYASATTDTLGLVKIGDKLTIDGTGLLNVPVASTSTFGVVKVGTEIDINDGVISFDVSDIQETINTAEANSATAQTFSQTAISAISDVPSIADTAQIKVQEKVVTVVLAPAGDVWTAAASIPDTGYEAVAVWNGLFVAVGTNKAIYSTDGGKNWANVTSIPNGNYRGITVENGHWVAVGESNTAAYSSDGLSWTAATTLPNGSYRAVKCHNGVCVAAGYDAQVIYSTDWGVNWTTATTKPQNGTYQSVAAYNNRFVIVGEGSHIAYSTDGGVNWTNSTTLPSGDYRAVAVYGDRWVAVGYNSLAAYSTDGGVTWTAATTPPSGMFHGLTVYDGKYMAVSTEGDAAYSTDGGDTWTAATTIPAGVYLDVTVANGLFVAVAYSGTCAIYSEDVTEHLTVVEAINRILEGA